jgi:uncharacterized protein (TIGR02001 family)
MQGKLGAMRAVVAAIAVTTSAIMGAAAATAADGADREVKAYTGGGSGPEFSVNATYTSDYRFRGFTQTREKPALQGGIDAVWPNFYVGLWASSVDFGTEPLNGFQGIASIEVVPYVGFKRNIWGYNVDLRAMYYAYPGGNGQANPAKGNAIKDLDYFEAMVGWSREIHPGLTLSSNIYYSPDYQGSVGQNWVFETGIARKLGTYHGISPTFSALLGSNYGEESKGGMDYYYWNAGVSFLFADYFELDLRYFDTFDVPTGGLTGVTTCRNVCDGRFVARITFEN